MKDELIDQIASKLVEQSHDYVCEDNAMSKELLPCPFCGDSNIKINRFSIDCSDCGGSIRVFTNRQIAVNAWNTRLIAERCKARAVDAVKKALGDNRMTDYAIEEINKAFK